MMFESQSLKIKENPKIFEDYLYNFRRVAEFYRWNPVSDWESCIEKRLDNYKWRREVSDILYQQNRNWSATKTTLLNVKKINESNTVAIITGQQAGIYGGPLYTIYKTLTAIKLAEELQIKYPDWNFVPIFWLEVGDSDYQEINHFHLLNLSNELVRLNLSDQLDDNRSISLRKIPSQVRDIHQQIFDMTPPTEFREPILNVIHEIYDEGQNFADAFARLLLHLFAAYGLVVINPVNRDLMSLVKPIIENVLEDAHTYYVKFKKISENLESSGYESQIKLDSRQTLLFVEDKDKQRCRVDRYENLFEINNSGNTARFSKQDLLAMFQRSPEKFTPNVALRPILQDCLLPTAAYVGGPAEISYAAQLLPLYQMARVTSPIFYPRIRITIVEKKIHKLLEKFKLNFSEIYQQRQKIINKYIQDHKDENVAHLVQQTNEQIRSVLEKLKKVLVEVEPTLEASVTKTEMNILEMLNKLNLKANESLKVKLDTQIKQLQKIIINFFPQDEYQERILNFLYYQIKYGPQFITELFATININDWNHQLILIK